MPDSISLPPMIVTASPYNEFSLQIFRNMYAFTWDQAAGEFKVSGGETDVTIVLKTDVPVHPTVPVPTGVTLTNIDTGAPFVIDGYIMKQFSWNYSDGSNYQIVLRVDAAGGLYAVYDGFIRYSGDDGHSWSDYDGLIPRAAIPPPNGGMGGGPYQPN